MNNGVNVGGKHECVLIRYCTAQNGEDLAISGSEMRRYVEEDTILHGAEEADLDADMLPWLWPE